MGEKLRIEYIPIDTISEYENNAKLHPQQQIEQIKRSIKDYGMNDPIGVWHDEIVEGHGRLMACKELGYTEVPVIRLEHMSDEQRKEYMLVHNQTTMNSDFDLDILSEELDSLLDFDAEFYDFDISLDEEEPQKITEDEAPEPPAEPVCKLGDIWQLGRHRLICGDSTDVAVIDRLMDGVKADMVFTDPPYNMQMSGGCVGVCASMRKVEKDIQEISTFDPKAFLEVLPTVFNKNMNAYIFCNKDLVVDYLNWGRKSGYSFNILVWKKPNSIPVGDSHRPDIEYLLLFRKNALWNNGTDANYSRCLQYDRVKKSEENGNHPTPKPIELIANELKISSNKNSVVVDFFGGSGSTLIACEQLNRKCYMAELDERYVSVIVQRWLNLTGRKDEIFCIRDGQKLTYDEVFNEKHYRKSR